MAEVTIGRVRIGWKGAWDNLLPYTALDCVQHEGESWVARVDVPIGVEPSDLNPEFWQIVARKGADGADGAVGPEGPQGVQGQQGPQGIQGPSPEYQWGDGSVAPTSALRFRNPDGSWGNWNDLVGPEGPIGNEGPIGPEGPQGPQGPQGIQGPIGPEGPPGPSDWDVIPNKPQTATRWPTFNEVSSKPDQATRWPTWDEVTGKPSSFPVDPSGHDHTSLVEWPRGTAPFNNAANAPRAFFSAGLCVTFVESAYGWPIAYGKLLNIPSYLPSQDGGAMQLLVPYSGSYTTGGQFMWRMGRYNNAGWTNWFTAVSVDDLASKLDSSQYTAADILAKLLTVDGAGSGLDSATVGGIAPENLYGTHNPPPASASDLSAVLAETPLTSGTFYEVPGGEVNGTSWSRILRVTSLAKNGSVVQAKLQGRAVSSTTSSKYAYARVLLNGSQVAYKSWPLTSTTYSTYTTNITVNNGDTLEIQGYNNWASNMGVATGSFRSADSALLIALEEF